MDPFYAPAPTSSSTSDTISRFDDPISGLLSKHQQELLEDVAVTNTKAFNQALQQAQPGDVVLVPDGNSYTLTGGVEGRYLDQITIDIAGTIHFAYNRQIWPFCNKTLYYGYKSAILLEDSTNVTITSSSKHRAVVFVDYNNNMVYLDRNAGMGGLINGDGKDWWNDAIAGRLPSKDGDTRPRLLQVRSCADVVVEKLTLVNSPFWTLTVEAVGAEVGHVNVLVDRRYQTNLFAESTLKTIQWVEDSVTDMAVANQRRLGNRDSFNFVFPVDDLPDWVFRRLRQPQDLNTDGIDPIGMHIHIHDCIVQNADDSVAVKPSTFGVHATVVNKTIPYRCTHNITIENMVLTGFGASIGSVGPTKYHPCVDLVTFRNITMPGTGKGMSTPWS
jgi:polygalacturonase